MINKADNLIKKIKNKTYTIKKLDSDFDLSFYFEILDEKNETILTFARDFELLIDTNSKSLKYYTEFYSLKNGVIAQCNESQTRDHINYSVLDLSNDEEIKIINFLADCNDCKIDFKTECEKLRIK